MTYKEDKEREIEAFVEAFIHCKGGFLDEHTIDEMTKWLSSSYDRIVAQALKDERKRISDKVKATMTNERKVAVFGKRMDSWEARSYDEKQLVNAVLREILDIINPKE